MVKIRYPKNAMAVFQRYNVVTGRTEWTLESPTDVQHSLLVSGYGDMLHDTERVRGLAGAAADCARTSTATLT